MPLLLALESYSPVGYIYRQSAKTIDWLDFAWWHPVCYCVLCLCVYMCPCACSCVYVSVCVYFNQSVLRRTVEIKISIIISLHVFFCLKTFMRNFDLLFTFVLLRGWVCNLLVLSLVRKSENECFKNLFV